VYAPSRRVPQPVAERARVLARQAVAAFEGKGVFGVEMFLLRDGLLIVNEIAPRPYNSGHDTIEAAASHSTMHISGLFWICRSPRRG
jgi:phosphoribosylaminoimidazole carboxylase